LVHRLLTIVDMSPLHSISLRTALCLVAATTACGHPQSVGTDAPSVPSAENPTARPGDASAPDLGRPVSLGDGGSSTEPGACEAEVQGRSIYLLTTSDMEGGKVLYRFEPATKALSRVGPVPCATSDETDNAAFAVDRTGNAWLVTPSTRANQDVFRVSTVDGSCTHVASGSGRYVQAIAFATPPGRSEVLYATFLAHPDAAAESSSIGELDPSTFTIKSDHPLADASVGASRLTGTGDGRLFADGPMGFAQIDATGAVLTRYPVTSGTGMAFWGGEMWLVDAAADVPDADVPSSYSTIGRYSLSARTLSFVSGIGGNLDLYVYGAAVSTCAPTAVVLQ
jgi:hypothetical protein